MLCDLHRALRKRIMKIINIAGPTNTVGLITLFEQRPFISWCKDHDSGPLEPDYPLCGDCLHESNLQANISERRRRVSELREAMRTLLCEMLEK